MQAGNAGSSSPPVSGITSPGPRVGPGSSSSTAPPAPDGDPSLLETGAPPRTSSHQVQTATPPPSTSSTSSQSPAATPFYPLSGGRTKRRQWADDDDADESDDDRPTSYLKAARRPTKAVTAPATSAPPCPVAASGPGGAHPGRRGHGQRRKKRNRPRPQQVHGMPARPVDVRVPARQRLGRRGRVSAPNVDGWHEILSQQTTGPAVSMAEPRRSHEQLPQARKIPVELHGSASTAFPTRIE